MVFALMASSTSHLAKPMVAKRSTMELYASSFVGMSNDSFVGASGMDSLGDSSMSVISAS